MYNLSIGSLSFRLNESDKNMPYMNIESKYESEDDIDKDEAIELISFLLLAFRIDLKDII